MALWGRVVPIMWCCKCISPGCALVSEHTVTQTSNTQWGTTGSYGCGFDLTTSKKCVYLFENLIGGSSRGRMALRLFSMENTFSLFSQQTSVSFYQLPPLVGALSCSWSDSLKLACNRWWCIKWFVQSPRHILFGSACPFSKSSFPDGSV